MPIPWAFLFAAIFWYSRFASKRQRTAVATMPPLCLRDSVRVLHSLSAPASLREELVCGRRRIRARGLGPLGEPPLLWAFRFAAIFWHSRAALTAEDFRCYNAPSVPPRLRESPSLPQRPCVSAREYSGRQDGAFAPDSWVPSARRPDFSIRGHLLAFAVRSRNGRGLPLLQQIFFVALRLRVRSGFLPGRDGAFAHQTELKRRAIRAAKDPMPTGWRVA
jgi:hypothetical protein